MIALTATATAVVQRDICDQLGLDRQASFIHGFRRSNIAIEVVETSPSQRPDLARELLSDPDRRSAIVYTPSRKQAESVAALLARDFATAAYHAGLDSDRRRRVQDGFLNGKLEVIVATIAFGMGIDKANIRSVIHTALPGSIEAYYQEIGRAGRDGEPSRAILMHSYADRYTHDFFFERDYPDAKFLDQIYERLHAEPQPRELLEKRSKVPSDVFERALEKLWTHGGVIIDAEDNLTRGTDDWRDSYIAQGDQKRAQIEAMIRYAQGSQCRMSSLVRHFGDTADSRRPCGICDFCAPESCVAQRFRAPTPQEQTLARDVMNALRMNRKVGRKAARGVVWKKRYGPRRFRGADGGDGALRRGLSGGFGLREGRKADSLSPGELGRRRRPSRRRRAPRTEDSGDGFLGNPHRKKEPQEEARGRGPQDRTARQGSAAAAKLKAWRRALATKQGVPAFRIMSDRVLLAIAEDQPQDSGGAAGHLGRRNQAGGEVRSPDLQDTGRIAPIIKVEAKC